MNTAGQVLGREEQRQDARTSSPCSHRSHLTSEGTELGFTTVSEALEWGPVDVQGLEVFGNLFL